MTAWKSSSDLEPWSEEEFVARLRAKRESYHIEHPFQVLMNQGRLTKTQIKGWVANRFYYQVNLPRKDAAILANCPDRKVRQVWVRRIVDHDGTGQGDGGIEAWIELGRAVGLTREEMENEVHVVPGVRFAVDAYVNFARTAPWQEAVCSALTELFAHEAHRARLDAFPIHYPWIDPKGLAYFRERIPKGQSDGEHALAVVLEHFRTRTQQERALEILQFKLDVLWSMLDAIHQAYPGEPQSAMREVIRA